MGNFIDLLNFFEMFLLFASSDATEIETRNWRISDFSEKLPETRLLGFRIDTYRVKQRSV